MSVRSARLTGSSSCSLRLLSCVSRSWLILSWCRAGAVNVSAKISRTVSRSGVRQDADMSEVLFPPDAPSPAPSESSVVAISSADLDVVPFFRSVERSVEMPADAGVSLGIPARMDAWMEMVGVRWSGQMSSFRPFGRVWDEMFRSVDFLVEEGVDFLFVSGFSVVTVSMDLLSRYLVQTFLMSASLMVSIWVR